MGYALRREVRDAIPVGALTSAERLLVLEIADQCNDTTRAGWPGADLLAEITDLAPRSIQETLARIGRKWIELRVPLGKDKSGKPYYSHAGRRTTFRFPRLQTRKGAMDPGALGAMDPGASAPEGATDPGGRRDGSVPKVRQIRGPSPQVPSGNPSSSPRSRAASLIAAAGAADDETEIVIRKIKAENPSIRSLDAYVAKLADTGDLAELVATVREGRRRVDVAEQIATARRGPQCIHGDPGGASLHPTSGLPLCALCRAAARRVAS